MGNFGFTFEGEADTLEKITQKLRAEAAERRNLEREEIAREIRQKVDRRILEQFKTKRRDGPFQKTLCWASYYTMVYTAICAFMPGQVASAAERVTDLFGIDLVKPATAPPAPAPRVEFDTGAWQLRAGG